MSEVSGQNFNNMYNCIWNVIITLSSVGYGELYPKTFFGRFIAIIVCFWGVFIVSFLVVIVTEYMELRSHWKDSYHQIVLLTIKQGLKQQAVHIMQLCYKLRIANRDEPTNNHKRSAIQRELRSAGIDFQKTINKIRSINVKDEDF